MGLTKHVLNGGISLLISVAATVALNDDEGTYETSELLVAVGISAFLSGLFTSYFASK